MGLGTAVAWNSVSHLSEFSSPGDPPGTHFSLNVSDSFQVQNLLSLTCLSGSNMMTATNYSNKQILENQWLQPSILKGSVSCRASARLHPGPGPDPLTPVHFLQKKITGSIYI